VNRLGWRLHAQYLEVADVRFLATVMSQQRA
jgi:hypothetical protein